MKETEFNLLEEPWIRVLQPDCTVREVSLTQALLNAQDYVDLAGELPTQNVAVLRLMLAVLHTVFSRVDTENNPVKISNAAAAIRQWKQLWDLGHFPRQPIQGYLEQWHERFWLFHPEYPFWQVPGAKIGTEYTAAKLNGELSESGNKLRLFPAYAGTGKAKLSYAQAARWLLYINGYDDTSAKPKGKGLPSPGAGWLGKLGLIYAVGNSLFETLMLNLTLLKDGKDPWGKACPVWELECPRDQERVQIPLPDNQAQLLTLQSRRLLLQRQDNGVTGYSLLGGDFFERTNAFSEQMTVWRASQEKKNAPVVYLPKRHDPSRQFWREFPSVFVDGDSSRPPGIVRWITLLQNPAVCCISRDTVVQFRIAAVAYGDKDFFATDTFSDALSFHASLLDEKGLRWRNTITEEIGRCERLAYAVGVLATEIELAAGSKAKTFSQQAREQFYFVIDQPFRQWLYSIDPEWDEDEEEHSLMAWREQAQKLARQMGTQLVEQAGTAAFVGRKVKRQGSGKKDSSDAVLCTAPKAYNHFINSIRAIYR